MHHIRASEIPMAQRLPALKAYLHQARRGVADTSTPTALRERLRTRIARIEAELARAVEEGV